LDYPEDPAELRRLLQNMNLVSDDGHLTLAGVLLFAERPECLKPQFVIKVIRYPGGYFQYPQPNSGFIRETFF
jgi:ATP-dependent DNA helicase RecG